MSHFNALLITSHSPRTEIALTGRRKSTSIAILLLTLLLIGGCASGPARPSLGVHMSDYDWEQYDQNKAWMDRRAHLPAPATLAATVPALPAVGVYADAGVWHLGARSIVESLESVGVPCRVIDKAGLTPQGLNGLKVLIIPGGWAPLERDANSPAALREIKTFVQNGGRYVGVCAGAYLATNTVKWYGQVFPYPIGLYDGIADGPVPGLSNYPKPGGVRLSVTDAGHARGLDVLANTDVYYNGGSCFRDGTHATVLARYPDGSAAMICLPYGNGEVILIGVHPERPAPSVAGPAAPAPPYAGVVYRALAGL